MADSNKTEQPTGKRLLKARGEGQFASSREIIAAANFLVFLGILGAWFPSWMDGMKQMLRQALEGAFRGDLTVTTFPRIAGVLLNRAFVPLSILAGLTTLTTIAVNLAVTKMGFSFKKLMPDFSRLNPAPKIKNLATQGPAAVGQAAAMLIIFSSTIYLIAKQNAEVFLSLPFASLDIGLQTVAAAIKDLLWKAAARLPGLRPHRSVPPAPALHQGPQDEQAGSEGRGQGIRSQSARQGQDSPHAARPGAPPHDEGSRHRHGGDRQPHPLRRGAALPADSAGTPVVVAKGKNYLALRIRQRAIENGVPLVENPPLAQALYKSVDVGREIPPHLYKAVAEVLAYIYRLTNARAANARRRA